MTVPRWGGGGLWAGGGGRSCWPSPGMQSGLTPRRFPVASKQDTVQKTPYQASLSPDPSTSSGLSAA